MGRLEGILMAYTEFTLWLTPGEPHRTLLRSTISQLAARFDAVEFEPHVTVFCGPSTDAEARAVARRVARQFSPIELTAAWLDHTEQYTKTLFVQFQESSGLQRILETAAAHYSRPSDYVLNPHLSLIYKKLHDEDIQRKLCKTLDVPMGSYRFDRARMTETELPIEDPGPVRRWRVVCDEPLDGSYPGRMT
jgi:2'-5' RNA ligase